jgi:signal transduction histidine kinase
MIQSLRLLIIEDAEDDALLLVRELRNGEFDPDFVRVETPQGLEAALGNGPWDAVISDYNLPAFNGLDALRTVRARGLDIPFILVSGVVGEEQAVAAMRAGAHDYIMKDRRARLVPALRRELHEAELRREQRLAEEELAQYREHLEELVQERTVRLEEANSVLRVLNGELEQQRHEMEQAKFAAEAADRAKGEFLTNMSHEMRSPLTGIMGVVDLILMGGLPAEEQRSFLEMAKTSADSLKRLINDILDFSRLADGKMSFSMKPFDLHGCIRSAADILALEASGKGLRFHLEIDAEVPQRMVCDEGRLRQVLVNLVGNAVKFTEQGEVAVSVRRAGDPARPGQDLLLFAVRDTGIGIPPEHREKIFEKFTRVESPAAQRYGGTGLGLTISRQIVENLGGEIRVESSPGEGSVFSFTIALTCDNPDAHPTDKNATRTGCATPQCCTRGKSYGGDHASGKSAYPRESAVLRLVA